MAKVLCKISGIEFSCEHLPIRLYGRELAHPIFYLQQKKLYGLYAKYLQGELTDIDSYLLYLAFFNSTELVEFRTPAQRNERTNSVVANNLKQLVSIVSRISEIRHPSFACAHICVDSESKYLDTSHIWIGIWNKNYADFQDGYRLQEEKIRIRIQEEKLQALIKDSTKDISQYAKRLAKWTSDAGHFPEFLVTSPLSNRQMSCSEYWQEIIVACCKDEQVFNIPKADLEELIEHCEERVTEGSIYSHALFQLLKTGYKRHKSFFGFGDLDISGSSYRIISNEQTVEDANKLVIIDNAPKSMPKESSYPNKLAFLKAKLAYQMAEKYYKENPAAAKPVTTLLPGIELVADEVKETPDSPKETMFDGVGLL